MNDVIEHHQTPADEDPLIDRYLGALPAYAPASAHFDDRVLAWVRRPQTAWVRRLKEQRRELIAAGWHRRAVGFLALGGLLTTGAVVAVAAVFHAEIAWGVDWLFATGLPFAWERVTSETSQAAAIVVSQLRAVLPDAIVSARGAASLAFGLAACAFGLSRTMKAQKAVTS